MAVQHATQANGSAVCNTTIPVFVPSQTNVPLCPPLQSPFTLVPPSDCPHPENFPHPYCFPPPSLTWFAARPFLTSMSCSNCFMASESERCFLSSTNASTRCLATWVAAKRKGRTGDLQHSAAIKEQDHAVVLWTTMLGPWPHHATQGCSHARFGCCMPPCSNAPPCTHPLMAMTMCVSRSIAKSSVLPVSISSSPMAATRERLQGRQGRTGQLQSIALEAQHGTARASGHGCISN